MFDATDSEIARREHAAEMGESDTSERAWLAWTKRVQACLRQLGWDEQFTGGKLAGESRGLDGDESENDYSIDGAYEAWEKGMTPAAYMGQVKLARQALGLLP